MCLQFPRSCLLSGFKLVQFNQTDHWFPGGLWKLPDPFSLDCVFWLLYLALNNMWVACLPVCWVHLKPWFQPRILVSRLSPKSSLGAQFSLPAPMQLQRSPDIRKHVLLPWAELFDCPFISGCNTCSIGIAVSVWENWIGLGLNCLQPIFLTQN